MNPVINLDSIISWVVAQGAAKTRVVVKEIIGGTTIGTVDVDAPANSLGVLQFITGQPLGTYAFIFSSIDANNNEGDSVELHFDYGGPLPPTDITVT